MMNISQTLETRINCLPCAAEKSVAVWGLERAEIQRSLSLLVEKDE